MAETELGIKKNLISTKMNNSTINSNSKLVNKDFQKAVRTMRRILPKLSFALLIGTYIITAIIMGIFHSPALVREFGLVGYAVAFLIPAAIQTGRGTLVFFFQLNPARMQGRFSMGAIAATVLLILSLTEAYLVSEKLGLGIIITVCTLMLIGYVIEIMIMKETVIITQMELYQNKDQWNELKKFYVAKEQFQQFMDDLREGRYSDDYVLQEAVPQKLNENKLESQSGLSKEDRFFLESNNYHHLIEQLEGKSEARKNGQHP